MQELLKNVIDTINTLKRRIDRLEKIPSQFPEAWIAPTFTNSWVNFGGQYTTAQYYKDPFMVVRLKGLVKSGTVGASIFTLPLAYRPAEEHICSVASNSAFGEIRVQTTGNVIANIGSNVWFSLDGITFRAV